jgi:hypothetical protein
VWPTPASDGCAAPVVTTAPLCYRPNLSTGKVHPYNTRAVTLFPEPAPGRFYPHVKGSTRVSERERRLVGEPIGAHPEAEHGSASKGKAGQGGITSLETGPLRLV